MRGRSAKLPSAMGLIHNPFLNKGTAFTEKERDQLGLRGLLPPRVYTQEEQVVRTLENLREKSSEVEKYVFLIGLQDRNRALFYRVLMDHLEEMMPIVYTPTVGRACQDFGRIFRRPRGIFITANDAGRVEKVLANWPAKKVRVIVVTDGERILGLGDLGAHGMGISIGKLALYTACAGVDPAVTLPVTLDVGTENEKLLKDPFYIGLPQRRVRGAAYERLVDEFVTAACRLFPGVLIQFEDFANRNAFHLLKKYRTKMCTFNDDIQGTASVALAGIYSGLRITRQRLIDQKILFYGAGEAGTGIADLCVMAMTEEGLSLAEARARCWFIDSQGLVAQGRTDLAEHKLPYAHPHAALNKISDILDSVKPTILIGVSGMSRVFTPEILRKMARLNKRPIVFALSNPTSRAECTAKEAYTATGGRAIFASGSPFDPVVLHGQKFTPGQGNNAYIFPGVGLGVVASKSKRVTDEMFLAAARTLAREVSPQDLAMGRVYPSLKRIREVSLAIAHAVAAIAYQRGLARRKPRNLMQHIKSQMFDPTYKNYV